MPATDADRSLNDVIASRKKKAGGARRSAGRDAAKPPLKSIVISKHAKETEGRGAAEEANAICRISNIPRNVTQTEFEQLFVKFKLAHAALHHDHRGQSLGIAEVRGTPSIIGRVLKEFSGVDIDGQPMELLKLPTPANNKVEVKEDGRKRRRKGRSKKKGNKTKMTIEQLDKELDEYMAQKAENDD